MTTRMKITNQGPENAAICGTTDQTACSERMYARWSNRMDTITVERDVLRRQLGKCLKKNDALRQDAERFRAIRQCRKTVQLYVYEVADDPFSGGWSYKNDPEDFDKFADAAMKEQK